MRAPWFYRRRYIVFGLVYGLSFGVGFAILGAMGIVPRPAFELLPLPVAGAGSGFALVLGGLALRIWGSSYLSADVMIARDPRAGVLHVAGPYRFVRNPLYLGNIMQAVGLAFALPWPIGLTIVVAITILDYALVFVEEPFLCERLGEPYRRYLETVPRMLPIPGRVAPAPEDAPVPSLREGLRAEAFVGMLPAAGYLFFVASAGTLS